MHNSLQWKIKYELGIEEIDLQHQYFVKLINRLSEALLQSDDTKYQTSLITELNAYAKFHFISEENMMLYHAYPGYSVHRQKHLELLDILGNKELGLAMNMSPEQVMSIIDFLTEWFLNHTTIEDKHFAEFLQNKGVDA